MMWTHWALHEGWQDENLLVLCRHDTGGDDLRWYEVVGPLLPVVPR